MPYSTPDDRRQSSSSTRKYQGRAGESRPSGQGGVNGGTRRVQARGGSQTQYRNRNRRARRQGGYALNQGGVRLNGRRGGLVNQALGDPKLLALMVVGLVLAIALLVGLLSLVRGCVSERMAARRANADDQDTRVSLQVSSAMASRLTEQLDRNELFAQIAQNAESIPDARLLDLVLTEPTATSFVAGYLTEDVSKTAQPYGDGATKGYCPQLYNWDARWGYVTYGNGPMAITGSGPTCLAMAYMGLTGKTDHTPDSLAADATQAQATDDVFDTKASFFEDAAAGLGLDIEEYSASGDNLSEILESGTVMLVQLHERSLTDDAHWTLAVSRNLDGSINLYDPTSTAVTEHPWDPATIAAGADAFYALSAASTDED